MLAQKEVTIGGMLRETARRFPEHNALEYMGQSWTYRQFDQEVDQAAQQLLGCGIHQGDHVGIWCETEPASIFAMYALLRIGAVPTMLNTSLRRDELKVLLLRSDVQYLLIGDGYHDLKYPLLCQGFEEELPLLKRVIRIGSAASDAYRNVLQISTSEFASMEELHDVEQKVRPDNTAFILFTSGTTGLSKGVLTAHSNWVTYCALQADSMEITGRDRFCVAIPLFHCFCIGVNILLACASGGTVCLPDSRHTVDILKCVSERRCTLLSCVPTLYRAILTRSDFQSWDLSSLRTGIIGGSTYPESFFYEVEKRFGMTLISSLGQTEATAGLTSTTVKDPLPTRATTVGRFLSSLQGKIADPQTNADLPAGHGGEICVRGCTVMAGYYNMPEETKKALDEDGWLHTGDMGFLDEDGYVHLTGRLKDLIIRGGENISPSEIENALKDEARISMCKAIGVPDDHYGEEICLCIVLQEGAVCTETELRDILTAKLAAFKIPRYILFFDSFPVSSIGKVLARELKQTAAAALKL